MKLSFFTTIKQYQLPLSMVQLVLLVSLYNAIVFNYPVISKVTALSGGQNSIYIISPILLTCAFIVLFSLLALPYLFKAMLIPLTISSALTFYASVKYNAMFDYTMMENIFETNSSEAFSYFNMSALFYFLFFGLIPTLLIIKVKITTNTNLLKEIFSRLVLAAAAILGIIIIGFFFYKDYASIGRNNKYLSKMLNTAYVYNSVKYIGNTYFSEKIPYKTIGEDAKLITTNNQKPTLMILLLGETARSQNIFYNGYQRNTNPYTQGLGIISFQHVSSCGTATAHSLPCMFSNMKRENYNKNKANNQDNVLDVLTSAGVDILWSDNDGGDKGVAKHIEQINIDKQDNKDLCQGGVCYDEVLVRQLDKRIKSNGHNQLITLHLIGSHGPTYWKRYPDDKAVFTPSCNQSDIENCSDQEIINVYDNTLVYSDYIIAETIKKLQTYSEQYNVALMYISDHGESLGENGLYLHGAPYMIAPDEQTKVPWFIWLPEQSAIEKGIDKQCLVGKSKSAQLSHDNFFHTLIGLFGVITDAKNEQMDIISSCKV